MAVIIHATSLDQGFPHCPIFLTAASRRSLGRISVPVWLVILSDQLRIIDLVGHYPTNYLIRYRLLLQRYFYLSSFELMRYYTQFPMCIPLKRADSYILLTRLPLEFIPKHKFSFDLHVLSVPLAFALSQDQTLKKKTFKKFVH